MRIMAKIEEMRIRVMAKEVKMRSECFFMYCIQHCFICRP
jgi:hypothetical protein